MRADRDAGLAREPHGPAHDAGIAAVIAAGDVRRGDARHHLLVGADRVGAERLAHVAIQIDASGQFRFSRFYGSAGQN